MIELLAILMIVVGLFLIFKGLIESEEESELERNWRVEEGFGDRERELGLYEYGWGSKEGEWDREVKKRKTNVKAGGVVLIGPIPIVFGDSKYAVYALILTILLMFMVILLMFWRW